MKQSSQTPPEPTSDNQLELTDEQMLRYARQIMLPNFNFEGQEALLASHVLVVGAGGLGCAVLPYLVASGVGAISLVDHDIIERSNLQRQILFREADLGASKSITAANTLKQLNSDCQIQAYTQHITAENIEAFFTKLKPIQLVIDCTDNVAIRELLNRYCFEQALPLLSGAAIRMEGQVAYFPMYKKKHSKKGSSKESTKKEAKTPCYQCFSYFFGEQTLTCMEAGVLSPVVGVIGTLQAVEALKILAQVGQDLAGRVIFYDAAYASFQTLSLKQRPDCPVCG